MSLNFLLKFLRHRNFPVVWRKSIWAQGGREPLTFRLRSRYSTTAPLHPCVCNFIIFMCCLPGFSGHFCSNRKPNFPAVSGSYLPGFSGRICSCWQPNFPALSVVTCRAFPGTRRPGFSGRICCFWPGFSGQQANCSGIYSGIFCS